MPTGAASYVCSRLGHMVLIFNRQPPCNSLAEEHAGLPHQKWPPTGNVTHFCTISLFFCLFFLSLSLSPFITFSIPQYLVSHFYVGSIRVVVAEGVGRWSWPWCHGNVTQANPTQHPLLPVPSSGEEVEPSAPQRGGPGDPSCPPLGFSYLFTVLG